MTQNIQVSKRFDDGTIAVIAGADVHEFNANAEALVGRSGADDLRGLFYGLIPAQAGVMGNASRLIEHSLGGQQVSENRAGAGSPPGATTLCPTHQQPAVWKEGGVAKNSGKPYDGFWKCPSTGESISVFGGKGLKPSCPPSTR